MVVLKGKKVIVIGESDGVPSAAIVSCMQAVGATVIFQTTQFFV